MHGPLRSLIVIALLALTAVPVAAAAASVDLDGDSHPEEVLLGDEVIVRRGGSILGRLSLAGLEEARLQEAPAPYLVLRGRRPGGEALLVAALHAGRLEEVYRGPIGLLGRDGELGVQVEVGREVIRYQTTPGAARCDGESRLFAHSYRPGGGWRRLELPVPAGPRLTARTTPPKSLPATPLPVYRVAAASEQLGVDRADLLTPPRELEDGRRETAWRVPDEGRGAWITLRAAPGHSIRGLLVVPAAGPAAPRPPRAMAAVFADGKSIHFNLVQAGPQWIELPQPVSSPCVSLVIVVGAPEGPTGLGEVAAYSELDGQGARGLADLVAAADTAAAEEAMRVLEQLLPRQTQQVLEAVEATLPSAVGSGRWRLQRLLASVVQSLDESGRRRLGATAATLLQRALAAAEDVERPPLWTALSTLPDAEQVMAALAGDAAQRPAVRAEAIGRLGRHGAATTLLRLQAEGLPDTVRPFWVEGLAAALRCLPEDDPRLAAAGAALLTAARRRPAAVAEAADLADAIGRARSSCREAGRGDATVLVEAWQALGEEDAFVARYRLLQALGQVGQVSGPVVALLRSILQGGGEPVLRRAAAQTAAQLAGDEMARLVRLGLRDEDPGVRMTALAAVAERHDTAAQTEVEQLLTTDAWPQVRRAAAEARAALCPAPSVGVSGPTRQHPLRAALDDPDAEVQRVALAGVARCEGTSAAPLLAQVARATGRLPALRGQACALLGRLQGAAAAPVLAAVVREAVDQAATDERQTGLAIACLRALGRAGGPDALPTVISVLGDNAAVDVTALEQLPLLCRSGVPPRLRRTLMEQIASARRSPERRLHAAAERAARYCGLGK
ncbi:MAG: HEAT repeat domain-containing protein [Myxococcota bacterium]|nr:HEAT repeat domain-containing protein [Myxococcota bacterium]